MKALKDLVGWLKNLFRKKETKYYAEVKGWPEEWRMERHGVYVRKVPKAGRQAIHQDIGKFMKHGRQSKQYRASIKTKKKLDENEI